MAGRQRAQRVIRSLPGADELDGDPNRIDRPDRLDHGAIAGFLPPENLMERPPNCR
jgi:hypothetical protein